MHRWLAVGDDGEPTVIANMDGAYWGKKRHDCEYDTVLHNIHSASELPKEAEVCVFKTPSHSFEKLSLPFTPDPSRIAPFCPLPLAPISAWSVGPRSENIRRVGGPMFGFACNLVPIPQTHTQSHTQAGSSKSCSYGKGKWLSYLYQLKTALGILS